MIELSENPSLKEINTYKKQLNWGDVSNIYHLASSSISDIDGILKHGFDSAYKRIFNKSNWNLTLLAATKDASGKITVNEKPKIHLMHNYTEQHYELHCYPVIDNERIITAQTNNPNCPFINWAPESMQILFRVNSLVPFIIYTLRSGDKADQALVRFIHNKINELLSQLNRSFNVTEISGYSIVQFCKELQQRQ